MGVINLEYELSRIDGQHKHLTLKLDDFRSFNTGMLDLGQISKEGEHIDALAAIFDLEGFTSFCNQTDPHLVIPEYMSRFLTWLFDRVSENFTKEIQGDRVVMWGRFPFFAKYTGDGILFLWDTFGLGQASLGNIIINLHRTAQAYSKEFFPEQAKNFQKTPPKLRCGIARGEVIGIGGSRDFIGPCINEASRLQKVGQLSFAFAKRGFVFEECFSRVWREMFLLKRVPIRGLGSDELVFVCRNEFDALPPSEQEFFKNP